MKLIKLALVATCLVAGVTTASAKPRENVTLHIPVTRVNFADPVSVANLRSNVARVIAHVCNPGDRIGADLSPDFQCRRELTATLEPSIAAKVAAATM